MKHSTKLKHASLADHGNCSFVSRGAWSTARCRDCGKLILIPNHVVVGSMAIGFASGAVAAILCLLAGGSL